MAKSLRSLKAKETALDISKRARYFSTAVVCRHTQTLKSILSESLNSGVSIAQTKEKLEKAILNLEGKGKVNTLKTANDVVDVCKTMAKGIAVLKKQTPHRLELFPAFRFARVEPRQEPRKDWNKRWDVAGDLCNWSGALRRPRIALKTSPIWQYLGQQNGQFNDATGYTFPPFAYNSGLGWREVRSKTLDKLGMVQGAVQDVSFAPSVEEMEGLLAKYGKDASELLGV